MADALHYAHKQGLVHRDIKPGNVLVDIDGRPYLADFGLALREENVGQGPRYAGTPAYMSPEQARGEGHRVDGRSDIYSLGTVLYELLCGRRTFTGSKAELLDAICSQEPKPPRQINDQIPKELERICLKTLSKRARERYTTARDLADDLRCLAATNSSPNRVVAPMPANFTSELVEAKKQELRIVPKGLRSFDEHDAECFLQ